MHYLHLNPLKPLALQNLFHLYPGRQIISKPSVTTRYFFFERFGFLQDAWLACVIPLLMPLLSESSGYNAETCNSPVWRGQSFGNRVVKGRERKRVECGKTNRRQERERCWRKNKANRRARREAEAGVKISLRRKRGWVAQILASDCVGRQKPFFIS